jgi:DNA double-strand break repair helicase HerA and related ATPase
MSSRGAYGKYQSQHREKGDTMSDQILIGKNAAGSEAYLLSKLANRHGLVAGATGTGKTVTLKLLAERFSKIGAPVFLVDVKGDVTGISQPGTMNDIIQKKIDSLKLDPPEFSGLPTIFWDLYGEKGHPIRTTVSEMGPLLLARVLDLNETQESVLAVIFKLADDDGLLLDNLQDLKAVLSYVEEHAADYKAEYGSIAKTTTGAITRKIISLEQQGINNFFGEPALDLNDLITTTSDGKGYVNLLAADKLIQSPKLYSTFLLWMLSELFERLPEVGDPDKPKFVFFFDEAHLLFNDTPSILKDKILQVVRLIRSKGVGVYFITQNPVDIPDDVLGQLSNRIQHALRAYTPKEQKAIKQAAETYRTNPNLDVARVVQELEVGEALMSFLDEKGAPSIVDRFFVAPPGTSFGPAEPDALAAAKAQSPVAGKYENVIDDESAYEVLQARVAAASAEAEQKATEAAQAEGKDQPKAPKSSGRGDGIFEAMAKSTARSVGSQLGNQIVRGVLGSIFGGKK